jgi:hypothetical protein
MEKLLSGEKRFVFDWTISEPHNVPLTWTSFVQLFTPPLLSYYVTAVLVQLPGTRWIRIALLPVTILLSFRAGTRLDLSFGHDTLTYLNQGLSVCHSIGIAWRTSEHPSSWPSLP